VTSHPEDLELKDFLLAVGQWPVSPEREENLDLARSFIQQAAARGASLCVLPEMFQTPYEPERLRAAGEDEDGPTLRTIRSAARQWKLHVVAGSFCERRENNTYNSSFVIGPGGEILGAHRKIHLFDVSLDTVDFRESSIFGAGDRPLVVDMPFCRLGVAICYDARFPAVFRYFEERGVEVVALPAAFSRETGAAHWHVLMRSRAVESQVYLAAACPGTSKDSTYLAYGHSLIVDPWGTVVAEAGDGRETIFAGLSAARLGEVRRRLPLLEHRRPDLYKSWT
jgi:omega-amidase